MSVHLPRANYLPSKISGFLNPSIHVQQLICCYVNVLILLIGLNNNPSVECKKDYITWDDLKLHSHEAAHINNNDDAKYYQKTVQYSYATATAPSPPLSSSSNDVIVVDQNGGADALSVQAAVDLVPQNNTQRVKIFIQPGFYWEKVYVPKSKPYISFIGKESHPSQTVISWNNTAADEDQYGQELGTPGSASVTIESDYFCATGLTFQNTVEAEAGEYKMQAVALRVTGDKAVFYKVRIIGTQDTLLDEIGTHYYYHSYIEGRVDFICGNAKSLFKDCSIHSTAEESGAIAAHRRSSPTEDTGFSFVNCVINGKGKIYLGRAWGKYSRTIYSRCYIDDIITPSGWHDWYTPDRQSTVDFGEYNCKGRGADRTGRVPWAKSLSYTDAKPFLNTYYINSEDWLKL